MFRSVCIAMLWGLLTFAAGATPPPDSTGPTGPTTTLSAPHAEPDANPPPSRPTMVPLPSAGLGGLALLSLMMFRRWFRQRL